MGSAVSIEGAELDMYSNTPDEQVVKNVEAALARGLPELAVLPATQIPLCIVGGGPSLRADVEQIKARWKNGQHVWALNGTHDFLLGNGIVPHAAWCLDSQPDNVRFYRNPNRLIRYYIASRCDPLVFDALRGFNITLWHDASCKDIAPAQVIIGGFGTIGIKAMAAAFVLGYRELHLFGYDSSYADDLSHHAYEQAWNDGEGVYQVAVGDRVYTAAPWMINQVSSFLGMARKLAAEDCSIDVHGSGLLPASAADYARQIREAEAA